MREKNKNLEKTWILEKMFCHWLRELRRRQSRKNFTKGQFKILHILTKKLSLLYQTKET